ncbi:MAG: NAD-binding protein, partial [Chthoniobacterales bacterium]|nr:NAD-binding protein [Chthoniobacterales bacterium]
KGQNSRTGIECGLLLAQTSELGIVSALVGMSLGILDREQFTIVALVATSTMTATQFLATDSVAWKLLHWHPTLRKTPSHPSFPRKGHVLILGFGNAGMWAAKPLLDAGYSILVVDDDPAVIEALEKKSIPCIRGDASDPRILEAASATHAALIIVSLPKLADALRVLKYTKNVKTIVRLFEDSEVKVIEDAGGLAVSNAQAACSEFLKWFENFHPSSPLHNSKQ